MFTKARLKSCAPAEQIVQEKIAAVQQFITDNYYHCANEILRGLGQILRHHFL